MTTATRHKMIKTGTDILTYARRAGKLNPIMGYVWECENGCGERHVNGSPYDPPPRTDLGTCYPKPKDPCLMCGGETFPSEAFPARYSKMGNLIAPAHRYVHCLAGCGRSGYQD